VFRGLTLGVRRDLGALSDHGDKTACQNRCLGVQVLGRGGTSVR
jgi:hypothetical protein